MARSNEIITMECACHRDTGVGGAYLLEPYDSTAMQIKFWIPKKLCKKGEQTQSSSRLAVYLFEIPEWWLVEKGLV